MRPAQPLLGVALIVGSVFLMSFGDALIKYNSASFTAWQIFALRSVDHRADPDRPDADPGTRRIVAAAVAGLGRRCAARCWC